MDQTFNVDFERGLVFGIRGKPFRRITRRGYIEVRRKGKDKMMTSAHRYIWERANGPIPPHLQINHINGCENR